MAENKQAPLTPAPVPTAGIPEKTKKLAPTYKEIQDGDIIPGKTREESQKIYDEQFGFKHPPKEKK